MAVVLFHLSGKMIEELQAVLPDFITIMMSYGYLGVPVFFVISGIVGPMNRLIQENEYSQNVCRQYHIHDIYSP